ncbi:hypothetical protein QQ045_011449 [Rhodiola kirilowii]
MTGYGSAGELSVDKFRVLVCGLWVLWFDRNQVRHGKDGLECDDIVHRVHVFLRQWNTWFIGKNRITNGLWGSNQIQEGMHMFYCDGSFDPDNCMTGFAAVEKQGKCVMHLKAGWTSTGRSSLEAELMAVINGMRLARSLQIEKATFYSDSLEALKAITKGKSWITGVQIWIAECFKLLEYHHNWCVDHVLREEVKDVDETAKLAREHKWSWDDLEAIPKEYGIILSGLRRCSSAVEL